MPSDLSPGQTGPKTEYLSTLAQSSLNVQEVLEQFGGRTVVLIAIAIEPKETGTGKLEERGAWIHRLWATTRTLLPSLHGCRLSWTTVVFMADTSAIEELLSNFRQILQPLDTHSLESHCLLATATSSAMERIRVLDDMQHDLQAKDCEEHVRFPYRLRNGTDWPNK